MANFCTRCGRRLQDGEICTCQTEQGSINREQQFRAGQQFGTQAADFSKNFFSKILNLVKRPVSAGKELIMEADVKTAIILIVLQGIFNSIFAMAVGHKYSAFIKSALNISGELSYSQESKVNDAMAIPYFRIIIVTVMFTLGAACLFALLMMAGYRVIKVTVSFQQMISAAAIRSAVLIPAIILSIVVFEISFGWGLLLFIMINIWGFAAVVLALNSFNGGEKQDIFVAMMSIVLLLFIIIVLFIFSKIWTFYLPDVFKTAIDELDKMSLEDWIEELV